MYRVCICVKRWWSYWWEPEVLWCRTACASSRLPHKLKATFSRLPSGVALLPLYFPPPPHVRQSFVSTPHTHTQALSCLPDRCPQGQVDTRRQLSRRDRCMPNPFTPRVLLLPLPVSVVVPMSKCLLCTSSFRLWLLHASTHPPSIPPPHTHTTGTWTARRLGPWSVTLRQKDKSTASTRECGAVTFLRTQTCSGLSHKCLPPRPQPWRTTLPLKASPALSRAPSWRTPS
jgi:hypothetical protein